MRWLLDTNAVIEVLRGNAALLARLRERAPEEVGVSAIVMHELFYGAFRSARVEANVARVDGLRFAVAAFEREDARAAGAVRAALAAAGAGIGPYDVLIGAGAGAGRGARHAQRAGVRAGRGVEGGGLGVAHRDARTAMSALRTRRRAAPVGEARKIST